MKIKAKIFFGFMVLVGLLLLISIVSYFSLTKMKSSVEVISTHANEVETVNDFQLSVSRILMPSNDYLIYGDIKERENFEELFSISERKLKKVEFLDLGKKEREILEDSKKKLLYVKSVAEEILNIDKPVKSPAKGAQKMEELDAHADELIDNLEELNVIMRKHMADANILVSQLQKRTTQSLVTICFLNILFGILWGIIISGRISKPIVDLTFVTKKIAKGDLTQRAEIKSKDETGQLASSFNQMVENLEKAKNELQNKNEELATMNEELESSNEELRVTTEELEQKNKELEKAKNELQNKNEELATMNEELESSNEELRVSTEELERKNKELKEAQEQLIRSEKLAAIGQLASGVGHELRNPLGVIKNAAYFIKSKIPKDDPKLTKHIEILEREIESSNKIISDLLSFSRTRKPVTIPNEVNNIIEEAISSIEALPGVELMKELNTNLPKVVVDKDQIRQVFQNIILNGHQAIIDRGSFKISTNYNPGNKMVEVKFSDTGIGIAKENSEKIFDPLFTTKAKGIGLGLAVCKEIVEKHSGSIKVESEVDKGTTFIVCLPIEKEEK